MNLSPEQLATLKAAIIADPTAGPIRLAGDTTSLLSWCLGESATTVWRPITSGDVLRNAVVWANMTPAAAADSTQLWMNRALAAQSKQISLQTLLQNVAQVASGVPGIRAGLNDCLTVLPTKSDGTNQAAGWIAVQTAMQRLANRVEALFAVGVGTPASPSDLVFEGGVSQVELNKLVN